MKSDWLNKAGVGLLWLQSCGELKARVERGVRPPFRLVIRTEGASFSSELPFFSVRNSDL